MRVFHSLPCVFLNCVAITILCAAQTLFSQTSTQTIEAFRVESPQIESPASTATTSIQVSSTSNTFSPSLKAGLFGAANYNIHNAQFSELRGTGLAFNGGTLQSPLDTSQTRPNPLFSGTQSLLPALGLAFESSFSPYFGAAARLSFAQHNGIFRVQEPLERGLVLSPRTGELVQTFTERIYSTRLSSIALEPLLMWTPFGAQNGGAGLKIYAGGRVGYMLLREIDQNHPFNDGGDNSIQSPNRTVPYSGAFETAEPLTLSVSAGVGYDIPLDGIQLDAAGQDKLILAPEIFGMWGLNQVAPTVNGAWNLHQLRAGISLFYRHEEVAQRLEESRLIDTIEVFKKPPIRIPFMVGITRFLRDTLMTVENNVKTRLIRDRMLRTDTLFVPPPPRMDVSVTAVGVESNGMEKPIVQVRFEEFLAQRYVPLLNYVFFEEQAFALPVRYKRLSDEGVQKFEIDKLYKSGTLDIYYHVLNIVGKRMRQYPDAVLTITGCNADITSETGNTALSEQRAASVRRYFLDTWKIAENRLVMKARDLSEQPSMPKTEQDKIEENRRVELTSTVREILDPVMLSDTVRTANPPVVRFKPRAKTDKPIMDWTLLVNYHDEEVRRFSSETSVEVSGDSLQAVQNKAPQELPRTIDWQILRENESLMRVPGPLQFILTASDISGNSGVGYGTIPVEQLTLRKKRREYRNDREFEQFSLILFQFNRAEISERNQHIIDFMKERIKPSSKLSIAGYTDRTGDATYNRTLSKQRATELARLLGSSINAAQGFGEDQLLYPNDFPEGRFYCRTVNVSIETPVKYGEK
ncbi:MAG: hypothetical protein EAZ92_02050 [Candidatus Kapaibacterium sp.]|nr:MAG: hypothetical protein EAZ92_02050 [Candidatus Kapabacteria bacterium]